MEKNERLDWEEAVEIADILTQTDNPEGDYAISENALLNKWSIDMSTFHEIINGVFKMIDFGISPITQTPFVGISKDKREWIAKKEVSQQFIYAIINWATEGDDIPEGSKGFRKRITKHGKPEFDITITKCRNEKEN